MKRKLLTLATIILFALGVTAIVAYFMGAFEPPMQQPSTVSPYCVKVNGDLLFLSGQPLDDVGTLVYNVENGKSEYRKVPTEPRVPCNFNPKVIVRTFKTHDAYSLMGSLVEVPSGTIFFDGNLNVVSQMTETAVCATLNARELQIDDGFMVEVYCQRRYMGLAIPSSIATRDNVVAKATTTAAPTTTPAYTGIPKDLGDPIRFTPNTKVSIGLVFKDLYGVRININNMDTLLALGDMICKVVDNWTNANLWVVRCYGTSGTDQGIMTIDQIWNAATGRGPVDWLDQPISFNDLSVAIKAGTVVYKDSDFKNAIGTYTQSIICNVQGMRWSSDSKSPWPAAYKLDCGWVHPANLVITVPAGIALIPAINSDLSAAKHYGHINDDGVRMRSSAAVRPDNVLLKLSNGTLLTIIGDAVQNGSLRWLPVRVGDTSGWVVIDYVTIDE